MNLDEIIGDLILQITMSENHDDLSNIYTQAVNRITGYDSEGSFIGPPDPLPAQYLMGLNIESNKKGE